MLNLHQSEFTWKKLAPSRRSIVNVSGRDFLNGILQRPFISSWDGPEFEQNKNRRVGGGEGVELERPTT